MVSFNWPTQRCVGQFCHCEEARRSNLSFIVARRTAELKDLIYLMQLYYIYILTNVNRTVLCIGVTNNLQRRINEHKAGFSDFTRRYKVHQLVYFEEYPDIKAAIAREKQLKAGSRQKKLDLINEFNRDWADLSQEE
jgi:putative endonuclease